MIEVRTQSQFNTFATAPSTVHETHIYPREDGEFYTLANPIPVLSNTSIRGRFYPKIKYSGNVADSTAKGMFNAVGTITSPLQNVNIRGLHLVGLKTTTGLLHGIMIQFAGISFRSGLSSGSVGRYDTSTSGPTNLNTLGAYIEDCIVEGCKGNGISIEGGMNSRVIKNVIHSNNGNGIFLNGGMSCIVSRNTSRNNAGAGIGLAISTLNSVVNDNIVNNNTGSGIAGSFDCARCTITGNDVGKNFQKGIMLDLYSAQNAVHGNVVHLNAEYGIYSNDSYYSAISNNTANANTQGNIAVIGGNNHAITGNTLQSGYYGIATTNALGVAIFGNVVKNSLFNGIYVGGTSSGGIIYGNVSETTNPITIAQGASSYYLEQYNVQ